MSKNVLASIDIGNHLIKVLLGRQDEGKTDNFTIIGSGFAFSHGMKRGIIVSKEDLYKSIQKAIVKAEQEAGVEIDDILIGTNDRDLMSIRRKEKIIFKNTIVEEEDIERELENFRATLEEEFPNKIILDIRGKRYFVDGESYDTKPVGLRAKVMEIEYIVFLSSLQHNNNLEKIFDKLGLIIGGDIPSLIASGETFISTEQKEAGCILIDIGAQITATIVYEDGVPIDMKNFPMGSIDITNDIALALKIPPQKAERAKIEYGLGKTNPTIQKVVDKKIKQIYQEINSYLKNIGKDALLPGGAILAGGSASLPNIEEIGRQVLKLPVEVISGIKMNQKYNRNKLTEHSSTWATSFGLIQTNILQAKRRDNFETLLHPIKLLFKKALNLFRSNLG